jgi:hypothetical protein
MCLVLGSFIPVSKVCLLHPFVFIGIKLHYDIMVVTLSLTIRDERQKLDLYFNTTLFWLILIKFLCVLVYWESWFPNRLSYNWWSSAHYWLRFL